MKLWLIRFELFPRTARSLHLSPGLYLSQNSPKKINPRSLAFPDKFENWSFRFVVSYRWGQWGRGVGAQKMAALLAIISHWQQKSDLKIPSPLAWNYCLSLARSICTTLLVRSHRKRQQPSVVTRLQEVKFISGKLLCPMTTIHDIRPARATVSAFPISRPGVLQIWGIRCPGGLYTTKWFRLQAR